MSYLVTFFKERLYKGSEYIVLKPCRDVHLCVLMISSFVLIPNIIVFIQGLIKKGITHMVNSNSLLVYLIVLPVIELILLIIFEGQYVKITDDEIKVVELVFIRKQMKIKDIIEREEISKEVGFRIASKDEEIIVRIFHLSKPDIDVLYKQIGYKPKQI